MERQQISDLIVDTKDHCFFCVKQISTGDIRAKSISSVNSIQYLSRYLEMDTKKILIKKQPIPHHLLTKVERSNLKVQLCEECIKLNTTFSKLGKKLEKIATEVEFQLNLIHDKLAATENPQFFQLVGNTPKPGVREKLEIADVLRAEAVKKCSCKIRNFCQKPRVRIQKISEKEVVEPIWRSRSHLRKPFTKTDTFWESDNCEPPQLEMEIKFETQNASMLLNKDKQNDLYDKELATHSHPSTPILKNKTRCRKWPGPQKVNGKYKCNSCDKIFQNTSNYTRHYQIAHLGVRFLCSVCNRQFKRKSYLKTHQQTTICGTGEPKPNKKHLKHVCHCSVCGKGFTLKSSLRLHLTEFHSQSQTHCCDVCGKKFGRKSRLQRHQRSLRCKQQSNHKDSSKREPPRVKIEISEIKFETPNAAIFSIEDEQNDLNDLEGQPEHSHSSIYLEK